MAEIPQHLLERSRARKQALGVGGGDAAATESGEAQVSAGAPAAPAGNAVVAAPPIGKTKAAPPSLTGPRQVPPLKNSIPWYVMPIILFLPVWALFYFGSLRVDAPKEEMAAIKEIPGAAVIKAQGFEFDPKVITVKPKQVIQFQNLDKGTPHNVVLTATKQDLTGTVQGVDAKEFEIDKAGTYPYFCSFHANMKGVINAK